MFRKIAAALAALVCVSCLKADGTASWTHISQEEAAAMMKSHPEALILDVRRPEEYAEGHIPGALNLPNETIGGEMPEELPDPEQILLVYCRSGNRSVQAAEKLSKLGYANIYEFGGINTWQGEIEK